MPGGKAEVVLDPPGGAGLSAEHGALDHERVEPLGGPVHRGSEPGGPAADDQQVHLLALRELEADAERAQQGAVAGVLHHGPAGEPHDRRVGLAAVGCAPASRFTPSLAGGRAGR